MNKQLRKRRKELNLTQKEAGKLFNVSQQMVAKIENGNPKKETLERYAKALGCYFELKTLKQYEPVLSTILLNWFDKNYTENRKECARLVIEGIRDYPIAPEQLKDGCTELKKTTIKDESLYTHIKLIGDLCNVGVSASVAGKKIRDAILKMRQ